jgi:hypothetical protein
VQTRTSFVTPHVAVPVFTTTAVIAPPAGSDAVSTTFVAGIAEMFLTEAEKLAGAPGSSRCCTPNGKSFNDGSATASNVYVALSFAGFGSEFPP